MAYDMLNKGWNKYGKIGQGSIGNEAWGYIEV